MEYGAIDLHLRRSHFRIEREDGTVVREGRMDTSRADLTRVFGASAPRRMLLESSTDSEWVAQHLESLGHEVIVADPNDLPMYGARVRRIKTDHRDTVALTTACRLGIYRRAHRGQPATRALRQQLRVRRHLVQMRTRAIHLIRALRRQEGLRLPRGSVEHAAARLAQLELPPALTAVLTPLRAWLATLEDWLTQADAVVATRATQEAGTRHLMTVPGVGPVIALTFHAILEDPARFDGNAARVSAFLGLGPSERSSADRQCKGRITKTGPSDLRALLVQAGWAIWRSPRPAAAPLRTWAHALAARRGRRIAIVALARRLSRILFALWRDPTDFRGMPPQRVVS
jgi:transposase